MATIKDLKDAICAPDKNLSPSEKKLFCDILTKRIEQIEKDTI